MKVFLGGTCNNSLWRQELIPLLRIDYFNPVVEDWTPECMAEERKQRGLCDVCLYVITPRMMGLYSIAEAVDDSNKRPEKTIICVLRSDYGDTKFDSLVFLPEQLRSLDQVCAMVTANGGKAFESLMEVTNYLNMSGERLQPQLREETKKDDGK